MYTEIRELVNFFARYFHLRVPRLKIGMFCEHMANNCLFRFQPYWNINRPKQYEELRTIRISHFYCDEGFTAAAKTVGVPIGDLLVCLPELTIYVNPGEVFFYCSSSDYSPPIPIWIGSVNESVEQQPFNALIPPQPLPSAILPPMQPSSISPLISPPQQSDFSALNWRISLSLVHPREIGYECNIQYNDFRMFRYDENVSVGQSDVSMESALPPPLVNGGRPGLQMFEGFSEVKRIAVPENANNVGGPTLKQIVEDLCRNITFACNQFADALEKHSDQAHGGR